jgi:hypothetical protein
MQENKQLVIDFFESDFYLNSKTFEKYIHSNANIHWNGSTGFSQLNHESFKNRVLEMGKSYKKLIPKISHVIAEGDKVCIRLLLLAEVSELEEIEQLADFMSIWEIKDNQLWRGYILSNPSDDSEENFESFSVSDET